jgi:hypothetical protein
VQLQVARRLGLPPQQMLCLRLVMQMYARMSREAAAEGQSVLQGMASLSISRVLEGVHQQSNGSTGSGSSSDGNRTPGDEAAAAAAAASPGAAAGEAKLHDGDGAAQIAAINSQLQRHMQLRVIQSLAASMFILDHMSRLQMAEMLTGE